MLLTRSWSKQKSPHRPIARYDQKIMNCRYVKSDTIKWVGMFVLLLASCEWGARALLGLGSPPLYVGHPAIEYMLRPDQDVVRFGNRYIVNQYGMRSEPLSQKKAGLRIMIFGDSVVNGGGLTDQNDLATSLLKEHLKHRGMTNAEVGNISAGSWGPGNWAAYADAYGFFEADVIVLVVSSHDAADNPKYGPLDRDHPIRAPHFAAEELFERYLFGGLKKTAARMFSRLQPPTAQEPEGAEVQGLTNLRAFLAAALAATNRVIVIQNLTLQELRSNPDPGYYQIRSVCEELGVKPVSLGEYYRKAMLNGDSPYRDNIHPNTVGQHILAKAIEDRLDMMRPSILSE